MESVILSLSLLNIIFLIIISVLMIKKNNSSDLSSLRDAIFKMQQEIQERFEKKIIDELKYTRKENTDIADKNREELNKTINTLSEIVQQRVSQSIQIQQLMNKETSERIDKMIEKNEEKMKTMTDTLEIKLSKLQDDNSKKLEEMRQTVDEKLHNTLEQRLGESFKLVSQRLEQVHTGLGEMKTLATGVGDLKKVLSNVKNRGVWGEAQLSRILEQIMSPEQYEENVATKKNSQERVEFAIKLPSKEDSNTTILLPIDAKFPVDIYEKLIDAQESSDIELVKASTKQLETRIKTEAKSISDKYINPPITTNFAVLFLPTESLYSEVLRIRGLAEEIQNTYKVVIAGPSTLVAFLNSLQMGFKTLSIQKHSNEVWTTLGKVKTEFGKFGDLLDKTQKKLDEASKTIGTVSSKSRNIERKLKKFEEQPVLEGDFPEIED